MPTQVVHFEIPADDTAQGREFWGALFGWQFQAFPGPFEYHMTRVSEQTGGAITNMEPGPPAYDDATAAEIRELVAKGAAGGGLIFETDDCQGTYESLKAAGVEFTQEPTERFYGIDCGLRDPFGNPIRFTQPPDGPIVVPSPEELEAQA